MEIKQGDIVWYDFGFPADARQAGHRPVVVIQSDVFNSNISYPLALIVPVTTKGKRFHVAIQPDSNNKLTQQSFVKCEQVHTVLKSELGPQIGFLLPDELVRVKMRLKDVMSI